ncbi:hypothetical protein [Niabella beijingensis]|uniref:hypothetical protein n=1 Tax=Niabella beijingensis TaxID=2872700 RepID=UPI001CBFD624|nr:hypothetical protein [Niabella beijingensis]MBZ4187479.1 hypothetical protein [Niabella beijingensis]
MSQSELCAATAVTDITPPLEVGLLTSSVKAEYAPFESIRTPLKARVLVLQSGKEKVAVVSLDLLSLTDTSVGGWDHFKAAMAGAVPAANIVICCTHTHSAPESGALTGLYQTPAFIDWLKKMQQDIRTAINTAAEQLQPCTLSVATASLEGYSLQRRIKLPEGMVISDSLQPVSEELMNGVPVDRRVKTVRLMGNNRQPVATVVQAVCHPVHEMCIPRVSADFPGELCTALEQSGKNGTALFLNGAAGNINPPTVSMGAAYSEAHGTAMADLVEATEPLLLGDTAFSFRRISIPFAVRSGSGISNPLDAVARISLVHFKSLAILFLPGEVFVETALKIEQASPFEYTVIAGFSENNIGYMPTPQAFEEGGYETGPGKWSFLEKGASDRISEAAIDLLHQQFDKMNAHLIKS